MKLRISIAWLWWLCTSAMALDAGRLADAIYRAEGGAKTRHPYGICSVRVQSAAHAREVCLRTIRRRHGEWDGRGCFIQSLASTYCPHSVDPRGNLNWVQNVRRFYGSQIR